MAVRIDETVVRDMGRSARGVNGPNLQEDDKIVSVVVGQPGDFLLTVCEKGVGKRSQIDEYRKTGTQRAKGVINVKITEKNGPVVAVIAVKPGDELMLMAEKGKVIRQKVDDVRETARLTLSRNWQPNLCLTESIAKIHPKPPVNISPRLRIIVGPSSGRSPLGPYHLSQS